MVYLYIINYYNTLCRFWRLHIPKNVHTDAGLWRDVEGYIVLIEYTYIISLERCYYKLS